MPHAGLVDENALSPEAAELLRARLHFRSGNRRLARGEVHEGISTLFDSMLSGLRWYVASPRRLNGLTFREGDDFNDEKVICTILKRSGVLDPSFDYDSLCNMVETVLDGDLTGLNKDEAARSIEAVLTALGVTPFDASELPPDKG